MTLNLGGIFEMNQNTIQAPENVLSENTSTENQMKPFAFTGKGSEFFSIWIVNVCLTIITLGIYSAWAKVRTQQYFYGNTYLDNISFQYVADPIQILKGRIIAFVAFAIYFAAAAFSPIAALIILLIIMAASPALLVLSMAFTLRNSTYRNVAFNFHKNFKRAYQLMSLPILTFGVYIASIFLIIPDASHANPETPPDFTQMLIPMIAILVIMLGFPWFEYLITQFRAKHAAYGNTHFGFQAKVRNYYGMYSFALAILIIAIAIISASAVFSGIINVTQPEEASESFSAASLLPLLFLPIYLWFFAFIQTKRTNLLFGNLNIGEHKLRSNLKTSDMMKLYTTNTIAILLSVGLLMPWAKVRTAKYRASKTSLEASGDIDNLAGSPRRKQSAIGEELGDAFGLGLGV